MLTPRKIAIPRMKLAARRIAIVLGAGLLLSALPALPDPSVGSDPQAQPGDHQSGSPAWERTLRLVRAAFPQVPRITTARLAAMRANDSTRDILLLDARSAAEFNVSHLHGAVLASSTRMALSVLEANDPDSTVVVYCSVGYRSSQLAAELRRRGHENVVNLEGSLFQWANEGRPLYRGEERVHEAHPYDEEWGQLLDRRFWSD